MSIKNSTKKSNKKSNKKYNDKSNKKSNNRSNSKSRKEYVDVDVKNTDSSEIEIFNVDDSYKNNKKQNREQNREQSRDQSRDHDIAQNPGQIINRYKPYVMLLNDNVESDIMNSDPKLTLSQNIDYPMCSLGFQHYIHANKNKMEILKQFEGKKKIYLVMNDFERYVDNYDNNIGNISEIFFDIKKDNKPNILSRGFYKLWEILHMFDLIDTKKTKFVSAHLAEGPGSFIQATMFYRDLYSKNSKNDKYYAVTLHKEDEKQYVPQLEESFIAHYKKEKPIRFHLHQTYPKQVAGFSDDKDNGDITDPKTIGLFGGQMGEEKADFITADGGFNWNNENTQEQEALRLIIAQIYGAISRQAKGGSFVCKFFETFTNISCRLILLLTQMYEKVYFVKPLMSRLSNSEKYCVCINFKLNDKDKIYQTITKQLESIMKQLHNEPDLEITKLWSDVKLPELFTKKMIYSNTHIANHQLKSINEIVEFIKLQNYHGDAYQMHRQLQIDASKYWIDNFMSNNKNNEEHITKLHNIAQTINEHHLHKVK